MNALELKVPPVLTFLISASAMWATRKITPAAEFSLPYGHFFIAALLLVGIALAGSGILRFREQSTTVHPRKPHEATSLVRGGVYRYTRNPMYLGLVLCLCACGIYLENFAALLWLAVYVVYMTRFQIEPEERILRVKFAEEYSDYVSKTRRWI